MEGMKERRSESKAVRVSGEKKEPGREDMELRQRWLQSF